MLLDITDRLVIVGRMEKKSTRDHILDTATELFWSKSYHGVNMNELSRTAGLNKATLYQHFASKEDIAVAAVNRAADLSEDYVYKQSFAETNIPDERLKRIYDKAYEIQISAFKTDRKCRGCPFVNIGVELATTNDSIRRAVARAFENFQRYYLRIVTDSAGDATASDNRETAAALMANMNGCLVAAKLENRPEAVLDGQKRALKLLAM